jgi:hypothetical protein
MKIMLNKRWKTSIESSESELAEIKKFSKKILNSFKFSVFLIELCASTESKNISVTFCNMDCFLSFISLNYNLSMNLNLKNKV